MAHQFPTTKDNRQRRISDLLFRNLPLIQVCNQHSAAVESGNWGMMLYYKFLYHLLEASEQDRKYNPDDVEKLIKVINTIEAIVKPIYFSGK